MTRWHSFVTFLFAVVVFALACPFDRSSGAAEWWVYGWAAACTIVERVVKR